MHIKTALEMLNALEAVTFKIGDSEASAIQSSAQDSIITNCRKVFPELEIYFDMESGKWRSRK